MRNIIKLLTLLSVVLLLIFPAAAEEQEGSLSVRLDVGELPVLNGAFMLYRVGTPISDGYRIGEAFGGGFVRREDARSAHLAQWLNAMEGKQGERILLDVDGNGYLSGLEEGLYLLTQTERTDGFYPIHPLLLEVENRQETLYLEPLPMVADSPATGQPLTPFAGLAGMVLSLAGMLLCTAERKRSDT